MGAKTALIWTTVAAVIVFILVLSYKIYKRFIAKYFAAEQQNGAARQTQTISQSTTRMYITSRTTTNAPSFDNSSRPSASAPPPYNMDYHQSDTAPPTYDEAIRQSGPGM